MRVVEPSCERQIPACTCISHYHQTDSRRPCRFASCSRAVRHTFSNNSIRDDSEAEVGRHPWAFRPGGGRGALVGVSGSHLQARHDNYRQGYLGLLRGFIASRSVARTADSLSASDTRADARDELSVLSLLREQIHRSRAPRREHLHGVPSRDRSQAARDERPPGVRER